MIRTTIIMKGHLTDNLQFILPEKRRERGGGIQLTGNPRPGRLLAGKLKDDHNSDTRESNSGRYFRICCTAHQNSINHNLQKGYTQIGILLNLIHLAHYGHQSSQLPCYKIPKMIITCADRVKKIGQNLPKKKDKQSPHFNIKNVSYLNEVSNKRKLVIQHHMHEIRNMASNYCCILNQCYGHGKKVSKQTTAKIKQL